MGIIILILQEIYLEIMLIPLGGDYLEIPKILILIKALHLYLEIIILKVEVYLEMLIIIIKEIIYLIMIKILLLLSSIIIQKLGIFLEIPQIILYLIIIVQIIQIHYLLIVIQETLYLEILILPKGQIYLEILILIQEDYSAIPQIMNKIKMREAFLAIAILQYLIILQQAIHLLGDYLEIQGEDYLDKIIILYLMEIIQIQILYSAIQITLNLYPHLEIIIIANK